MTTRSQRTLEAVIGSIVVLSIAWLVIQNKAKVTDWVNKIFPPVGKSCNGVDCTHIHCADVQTCAGPCGWSVQQVQAFLNSPVCRPGGPPSVTTPRNQGPSTTTAVAVPPPTHTTTPTAAPHMGVPPGAGIPNVYSPEVNPYAQRPPPSSTTTPIPTPIPIHTPPPSKTTKILGPTNRVTKPKTPRTGAIISPPPATAVHTPCNLSQLNCGGLCNDTDGVWKKVACSSPNVRGEKTKSLVPAGFGWAADLIGSIWDAIDPILVQTAHADPWSWGYTPEEKIKWCAKYPDTPGCPHR